MTGLLSIHSQSIHNQDFSTTIKANAKWTIRARLYRPRQILDISVFLALSPQVQSLEMLSLPSASPTVADCFEASSCRKRSMGVLPAPVLAPVGGFKARVSLW